MVKIVSRIEKIKLIGGNTTEAEKLIAEARTSLTTARAAYVTLQTIVTDAGNATTTRETLTSMRDAVKVIDKHLRDAHKSLQKTVGSLRGVSQLLNATSTNSN